MIAEISTIPICTSSSLLFSTTSPSCNRADASFRCSSGATAVTRFSATGGKKGARRNVRDTVYNRRESRYLLIGVVFLIQRIYTRCVVLYRLSRSSRSSRRCRGRHVIRCSQLKRDHCCYW